MLEISFLGTGTSQGVPIIGSDHPVCISSDKRDKRLRVSVLIQWKDFNVVIDCGPDFRQQMLLNNIKKLDALFFTHEHADHTAGLDDIRPYCFRNGNIPIYAHKRVLKNLSTRFSYIFNEIDKYPGAPSVTVNPVTENESFTINKIIFLPVTYLHAKLQVFGYRINNFAYITDLKTINNIELDKLKGLEVLVLNAIRIKEHFSHLNLKEALDLISIIKPKKTYLTHISHLLGFHNEVSKSLPKNVFLSYDGLTIEVK